MKIRRQTLGFGLWALGLGLGVVPVSGQPQAQVEPIRCWWQSSTGAITIGQSFSLAVTCAVVETSAVQVVPDESRLGIASVQLAPFELLGGDHPPDAHANGRRFLQYRYQLRLIDRDAIGKDVRVPDLTITYRVRSGLGANQSLEGRDLAYVLPAITIKVLSLVPASGGELRDGGSASLADVDALNFRSDMLRLAAVALGVFALAALAWAASPIARRVGPSSDEADARVADAAVLRAVAGELSEVQSTASREGWTDDLVGRGLRALRVVAAYAAGRTVSQHPLDAKAPVPEGRLAVSHGLVRRARLSVSSGATALDLERAIATWPAGGSETDRQQAVRLQSGLAAFAAATYPAAPRREPTALDEAVREGAEAARRLAKTRGAWRFW